MFNKKQREILGSLSYELTGATSSWQKMVKNDARFRIVESVSDHKLTHVFDGRRMLRMDTARNLGLVKSTEDLPTYTRTVSREPTFDELHEMLAGHVIEEKMRFMDDDQQLRVLTYLFSKKRHPRVPLIQVVNPTDPEFRATVDGLADQLPDEYKEFVKTATNSISLHGFDAQRFLSHLLFSFQHPEEAENICANIVSAIQLREPSGRLRKLPEEPAPLTAQQGS